jgi:hypothetical protein
MNEKQFDRFNLIRGYLGVIILTFILASQTVGVGAVVLKEFPISSCQEIRFSGTYYLTDNIWVDPDDDTCLDLYVNDVTIDGRGHTIYGSDTEELITVDGVRNTLIKNINLRSGITCIEGYHSNSTTITNVNLECTDDGIDFGPGYGLWIHDNNISSSYMECIYIPNMWDVHVYNNNLDCLGDGVYIYHSGNVDIHTNKIIAEDSAIMGGDIYTGVLIYNNYLKSYGLFPAYFFGSGHSTMSINKQLGRNIIAGPYLGGNYYTRYNRQGYSDLCLDNNRDGLCDQSYSINGSIDNFPLTKYNPYGPISIKAQ